FAEHYAKCGQATFQYHLSHSSPGDLPPGPITTLDVWIGSHRATFADGGKSFDSMGDSHDYFPVTTGSPPTSVGFLGIYPNISLGRPGATFQVRPSPNKCNGAVANTPHSAMPVAMMDGSVRFVAPSIAETVYWGLVTPDRREEIGDW